MLSTHKVRLLKKIMPYVIIMIIGCLIYSFLEKGLLAGLKRYPATGNIYSLKMTLIFSGVLATILGLVVGGLEEVLFKNILRRTRFGLKVFLKTILYLAIIVFMIVAIGFPVNAYLLDLPLFHPKVLDFILAFTHQFVFYSLMLYVAFFIALSLFFSEMIDHIGTKAIANFFTGHYHTSKIEDRIFMFLDMKSSTTIAEKIGHEQYFELLNNFYEDMTDAIVKSGGEIYQYVGDEIVVSWELGSKEKNNRCIDCFFLIRENISKNESLYIKYFGLQPEFKAGMHCGTIAAGEIGVIKKDILLLGDVLNTTSRIQDLCNEFQSDFLISEDLLSNLDLSESISIQDKGEKHLKGRDQVVRLYAVGCS